MASTVAPSSDLSGDLDTSELLKEKVFQLILKSSKLHEISIFSCIIFSRETLHSREDSGIRLPATTLRRSS